MTYNEFKATAITKLSSITDNARFETDTLITHFSGMKKNEFLMKRANEIPDDIYQKLDKALERRMNHEPLQYIIGEWEFFGLRIFCGEGCLIPRPETELLAELAIKYLPRNGLLLDLCTGSGCVPIAVLNNRPDVRAIAVDVSEKALSYAKKNAEYHDISESRLRFIKSDIYEYTPSVFPDMITSNPPYIKSDDIKGLSEEVLHEPSIALDGGHDGLDFYKVIVKNIVSKYLKDDGYCAVEVGYDIGREVAAIFKSQRFDAKIIRDMFEVERICLAKRSRL